MGILANQKRICKKETPSVCRKLLVIILFLGSYAGIILCCTMCSIIYGWDYSCNWLWSFLIAIGFDLIVFEPLIWLIYLIAEATLIGEVIRLMKKLKMP